MVTMYQKSSYPTILYKSNLRVSGWVLVGNLASTDPVSNTINTKDEHSQKMNQKNALKEAENVPPWKRKGGEKDYVRMLEMCPT